MKNRRSNKFAKAFCFCRRKCSTFCQIICSPPFLHTPTSHNEVQKANFLILLTHVRAPFNYYVVFPTTVLLYWLFGAQYNPTFEFLRSFFMGMKRAAEESIDPLPLKYLSQFISHFWYIPFFRKHDNIYVCNNIFYRSCVCDFVRYQAFLTRFFQFAQQALVLAYNAP